MDRIKCVLYKGVRIIEVGNVWFWAFLWPNELYVIERCLHYRGVRKERLDCTLILSSWKFAFIWLQDKFQFYWNSCFRGCSAIRNVLDPRTSHVKDLLVWTKFLLVPDNWTGVLAHPENIKFSSGMFLLQRHVSRFCRPSPHPLQSTTQLALLANLFCCSKKQDWPLNWPFAIMLLFVPWSWIIMINWSTN